MYSSGLITLHFAHATRSAAAGACGRMRHSTGDLPALRSGVSLLLQCRRPAEVTFWLLQFFRTSIDKQHNGPLFLLPVALGDVRSVPA